ncbi:MAG: hypothetical protein KDA73_18630 [Rhodobacteraceae bacterium]|nr:hypothetical protein [Paracoccaceae bacterium]
MSRKDGPPRLRTPRPSQGYEVGYGKPPKETRFCKGQSGNPAARPKGARNKVPALNAERLKAIVMEEAYRSVAVRDGAREVKVPIAQAVIRSLAVNAARGNARAQRLFTEMLWSTERENKELADTWLETAMTYKIEWERELDRRARLGITDLPPPLPHPDHIIIDMNAGTARVIGPMTREQKATYDQLLERKAEAEVEAEELTAILATEKDPRMRAFIEDDLAHTRKILEMFDRMAPPA